MFCYIPVSFAHRVRDDDTRCIEIMTTEQKRVEDYFPGADLISLMSDRVRQLDTELAEKLAVTGGFMRDLGNVSEHGNVPASHHNELIDKYNTVAECLHAAGRLIAAMKIVDDGRATQLASLADETRTIHRQSEQIRLLEVEITRLAGELEKAKKPASTPTAAAKA